MRATVLCMVAFALGALAWWSSAGRADLGSPVAESCPKAPEPGISQVFLTVMDEPSLSCGALEDTETYRVLWLRTFHNPIAVRVFRRDGNYGLEAVILDGKGGYAPGNVSQRVSKELSHDQWQAMIAKLESVQFWRLTTRTDGGLDGARWIVEARRDGRYHSVDRWSGTDGLESAGRLFLELADLSDVKPVY
jgi:hypothetical protein